MTKTFHFEVRGRPRVKTIDELVKRLNENYEKVSGKKDTFHLNMHLGVINITLDRYPTDSEMRGIIEKITKEFEKDHSDVWVRQI